jgi:hypothetical protein
LNYASRRRFRPARPCGDNAKVIGLDRRVDIGLGAFAGCLATNEWTPLRHGDSEQKSYCPGAGGLALVRELHGKTTAEPIEIDLP